MSLNRIYPFFRGWIAITNNSICNIYRTCRIQYDGSSLRCLLRLVHYNAVFLCRGFVTIELVPRGGRIGTDTYQLLIINRGAVFM